MDSFSPANCLHGPDLDLFKPLGWHLGLCKIERRSQALLTESRDARLQVFFRLDQAKVFSLSSLNNPPLSPANSPGLLAADRHLPLRPPRDAEEESKGSAPLAKDDTDDTRLPLPRPRGAAPAAVGVGVGVDADAELPPLVLAWPPRAETPPELREAQVVVVARIVKFEEQKLAEEHELSFSLFLSLKSKRESVVSFSARSRFRGENIL